MAPPSYADIGKQARDVFGKGYHFGLVKLDVKTKTTSGVEFNAGGTSVDGKVAGSLETKYKIPAHGLTLTEKWNTTNVLNTTVDLQDKLVPGLKLTLDTTFKPETNAFAGKLKEEYKHEKILFNADVNLQANPVVNASAVFGYGPWALGYQAAFDTGKKALTANNFAVGYTTKEMIIHANGSDKKVFGGGVYHKISPDLETGVTITSAVGGATSFGIGCKYSLGKDCCVRAKVDNSSVVGLSYQQQLREGITLTFSTAIDGNRLNEPGHKVGLALEMEA